MSGLPPGFTHHSPGHIVRPTSNEGVCDLKNLVARVNVRFPFAKAEDTQLGTKEPDMALSIEDPETERLARLAAKPVKLLCWKTWPKFVGAGMKCQSRTTGRQKRFLDMTSTLCLADGDRYIGYRGNRSQRA